MLNQKIILNKGDSYLDIPLNVNFDVVEDVSKDVLYYTSNKLSFIPTIENADTKRFIPANYSSIEYRLNNALGGQLYYSDLNLTFDDVRFNRNRYKNSFLRVDIYDSPEPYNQRLVARQQFFNRTDVSQRDINGNLLPITSMPVNFTIYSPTAFFDRRNENFYLFLRENVYSQLYFYFYYANAVNGQIIPLNASAIVLNQQNVLQNNYVVCNINNGNAANTFSFQTANKTISLNPTFDKITINLKQTVI